jgi:uncharacterized protein with von Willebrand factor type A (vWA) domain
MTSEFPITENLIGFCRFLRANGFSIGIKESADAVEAMRVVNITDRSAVKFALCAILCSSKEEVESFDRLFEQYWNPVIPVETKAQPRVRAVLKAAGPQGILSRSMPREAEEVSMEVKQTTGASAVERIRTTDFSMLSASDLQALEQIAFRLWKQMSVRLIRRWKQEGQRGKIDLRRTIRQSIGRGGEPLDLRYRDRKKKRIKLVTLLDVSGSMDLYSMFFLRFLYALHKYFKRVDSFLFSTRLTHVTRSLQSNDLSAVMSALSQNVEDWSGGTRIGDCLRDFNHRYAPKILTRSSLVIILSDGWDTGSAEALAEELRAIKRRAGKLIWLNPLLGSPDYQPVTRGMAAALPFADVFAPAHNLESLLELEKHLHHYV